MATYVQTSSDCSEGYVCAEAPMEYEGDTVTKDCVSS